MKCKICHTEFNPGSIRFKTCSEPCKLENVRRNKNYKKYYPKTIDVEHVDVIFKNQFLLRNYN